MTRRSASLRYIIRAALIAAIYAALTLIAAPLSFGLMQIRISEALCVLPALTPAAIPGLAIGCLLSNMIGGYGLTDIFFGAAATLTAAFLTRLLRQKTWLLPLPPVICNAFIIGAVLHFAAGFPFWLSAAGVGAGELVSCYVLGLPLLAAAKRIFPRQ